MSGEEDHTLGHEFSPFIAVCKTPWETHLSKITSACLSEREKY